MKKQTLKQNIFVFGALFLLSLFALQSVDALVDTDITVSDELTFVEGTERSLQLFTVSEAVTVTSSNKPSGSQITDNGQFIWEPGFDQVSSGISATQAVMFTLNSAVDSSQVIKTVTFTINNTDVLSNANNFVIEASRSDPDNQADVRRETFVLTNVHSEALENLVVTKSAGATNIRTVTLSSTSVAPSGTLTLTVDVYIPASLDSIDSSYDVLKHNFGAISITGFSQNVGAVNIPVLVTPENELKFEELVVDLIKEGRSEDLEGNDRLRDVKPGEKLKFNLTVESGFSNSDDPRIEDVDLSVSFSSNSDISDSDNDDFGDNRLDDGDTSNAIVDVELERSANGDFDIIFSVRGTDENNAIHGFKRTFEIEVDQQSHELIFESVDLTPNTVSCDVETTLSVVIGNIGKSDEDEVVLKVSAPTLSFNQQYSDIDEIREAKTEKRSITIPVPTSLATGTHRVTTTVFYETDVQSDTKSVTLTKQACSTAQPPEPPVAVPPQPNTTENNTTVPDPVEKSGEGGIPFWLIIIGYVVVLAAGAVIVFLLIKKKA